MAKVLIIEDDLTIRTGVVRALGERGHVVASSGTAMEGLKLAVAEKPDVILLDLGLPDLDGREMLRMLRAVSQVPVIVATARRTEEEIVRALDAGADDYVVKPYGASQIDARIRAILRRSGGPTDEPRDPAVTVGGLRIDSRTRIATLDGALLDLTPREFELLHYLAVRAGDVVSKRELLTEVWQVPYAGADKTVDVHLSWLRRKLGETAQEPKYLHTVRRVGVRLVDPAAGPAVRRRLALLTTATMAIVLIAFLVPLAVLVRRVAAERAVAQATTEVQSLVALVATNEPAALRLSIDQVNALADHPVTVYLPGGETIGAPAARSAAVELAARGRSFSVAAPAGREILVAVQNRTGTAVIRTFVPAADLTNGVTRAWLTLAALGLVLLGLGVVVADRLAVTLVRPIRELAGVSHRLAGGDLSARAAPAGPAEIRGVAQALNHLAGRIRELLAQERESVADLSHRMRTPLTALRLDAEGLHDPEEAARIVGHVGALDRAVTGVIENARRPADAVPTVADASGVVAARAAFWAVLAEDQERPMTLSIADGPLLVAVSPAELAACVDALLGNVFAHTPDGAGFFVRLEQRAAGGAVLAVGDAGPGLGDPERLRRGVSGAGSTGLGLDIARRVADESGGALSFGRSALGGAEVRVELGSSDDL